MIDVVVGLVAAVVAGLVAAFVRLAVRLALVERDLVELRRAILRTVRLDKLERRLDDEQERPR